MFLLHQILLFKRILMRLKSLSITNDCFSLSIPTHLPRHRSGFYLRWFWRFMRGQGRPQANDRASFHLQENLVGITRRKVSSNGGVLEISQSVYQ